MGYSFERLAVRGGEGSSKQAYKISLTSALGLDVSLAFRATIKHNGGQFDTDTVEELRALRVRTSCRFVRALKGRQSIYQEEYHVRTYVCTYVYVYACMRVCVYAYARDHRTAAVGI